MSVRGRTNRATSMLTVATLVTSGLMAVSAASGARVAPAVAAPAAVSAIPTAVSLEADRTEFAVGETVTLTATPDEDVTVSSSYKVVIKDVTTGGVLGYCGKSSSAAVWSAEDGTCAVKTSFATGGAHTYRAYVAADTSLNDTQATSNDVVVSRAAWTVTLATDRTEFVVGERATLTATVNQDVKASSYMVVIKDLTSGGIVGRCERLSNHNASWSAEARTCTAATSFSSGDPHTYRAYVAAGTSLADEQASSNEVTVQRAAWTVLLAADRTVFAAGEKVTLTATVNQNIKGSGYMVMINDETTGGFVGRCENGSNYSASWSAADLSCVVTTSFTSGDPHTYRAYVVSSTSMDNLQAKSNDVVVARAAWTVSLTADKTEYAAGEKVTLTASVNQDIKASGYMVMINDETTKGYVGRCERGSNYYATWSAADRTCTVTVRSAASLDVTGDPYGYAGGNPLQAGGVGVLACVAEPRIGTAFTP